jgi:hypothetical protein
MESTFKTKHARRMHRQRSAALADKPVSFRRYMQDNPNVKAAISQGNYGQVSRKVDGLLSRAG